MLNLHVWICHLAQKLNEIAIMQLKSLIDHVKIKKLWA